MFLTKKFIVRANNCRAKPWQPRLAFGNPIGVNGVKAIFVLAAMITNDLAQDSDGLGQSESESIREIPRQIYLC